MSADLLTIEEAAAYLNVKERWVRRQIASRTIEFIKIGHFVRFKKEALDRFVESNVVPPQEG